MWGNALMGIDAEMKVRTAEPITDDQLLNTQAAFRNVFPADGIGDPRSPHLDRDLVERGSNVLEVWMIDRFYSPHYARGDWVYLRKMGDWLAIWFGETAEVRYGSDSGDTDFESLTPWSVARAENEEHWATVGHLSYHRACNCDHCVSLGGCGAVIL